MVGESAQATAERQTETAGRLIESSSRWAPGGRRESITASELHAVEQLGWTVLHDVKWPGKRFGTIDHVVIGGGQVWVISAKKWAGSITVTGGVLKENGRSRQKYVAEVAEQTQGIASLSPMLPPSTFHPILCVEKDEWVNERFGDVWICSSLNLAAVLETPAEKGPDYVHNDLVRQLEEALKEQAAPPPPVQLHPEPPTEKAEKEPKISWRARRAYLKDHNKTQAPSGSGTSSSSSRKGLAILAVAGLTVASVLFFKPTLITQPAGSVTDSITGVFWPGDSNPSPPAEDKPKKKGNKNKQQRQQQQQQQEQAPTEEQPAG